MNQEPGTGNREPPTNLDFLQKIKGKKLKITIRPDRATLIICFGIALIFWFFVKLSNNYDTIREVTLHYRLPEGRVFVDIPPEITKATLNGSGWDLFYDYLTHPSPEINFHLGDYPSQTIDRTQLFNRIRESVSSKIKVINADREFILLNYEKEIEKTVPVIFDGNISFLPGYDLKDMIFISPDSVRVLGPYSLLRDLSGWETEPLFVEELNAEINRELALKLPERGQITLLPPKVAIQIRVEEFTEKTVFVPVEVKNATDSIRIFPAQIQVHFVVGLSHFNEVSSKDFAIEADLENISPSDVNNTIPLSLVEAPSGIKGLNYNPKSVEFFIVQKAADSLAMDSLIQNINHKN